MSQEKADFVVVANRLPVDLEKLPDGSQRWKRSPGGLVTALEPMLRSREGAWVGWPGIPDAHAEPFEEDEFNGQRPIHGGSFARARGGEGRAESGTPGSRQQEAREGVRGHASTGLTWRVVSRGASFQVTPWVRESQRAPRPHLRSLNMA